MQKMKFPEQGVAWNVAIKKQGKVKIGLNYHKLFELIRDTIKTDGWRADIMTSIIIQSLPELLEVKEKK